MSIGVAIRYHQHGKPLDVLRVEDVEVPAPGDGEVQIRMLAATINPSDFGMIAGTYGRSVALPATAGREGAGEVVAVGENVDKGLVGRRVRIPDECGSWQTLMNAPAGDLWFLPDDIPLEIAAMAFVNPPTAWRLLRDANLQKGDWVIQNAANSAVGVFVAQMARHLGLHVISVVRRKEVIDQVRKYGSEAVLLDDNDYPKQIESVTGGVRPHLAINSVGGESAIRLIKSLAYGGRMVTIGGASFEPVRFPTRQLIFNDIILRGFWMDRWYRTNTRERAEIMFSKIFALMRDGVINAPVEGQYKLHDFAKAIEHASKPRFGKVLFSNA